MCFSMTFPGIIDGPELRLRLNPVIFPNPGLYETGVFGRSFAFLNTRMYLNTYLNTFVLNYCPSLSIDLLNY